MFHRLSKISSILILLSFAYPAEATIVPPPVLQAIVWIGCDDRQGTGTVISGEAGYVLTNAHVAIDIKTKIPAESCVIGFTNGIGDAPMYYYDAHIVRYVFNQNKTQDFAILQIENAVTRNKLNRPFPFLRTNEFPAPKQHIRIIGYSNHDTNKPVEREGFIDTIRGGWLETNIPIQAGDSGGSVIDDNNALIGMPTATVTITSGTQIISENSQIVDIRAVINWLDEIGKDAHDSFLTHLDYPRYHSSANILTQDDLGCDDLVRTIKNPAVYCVMNGERYVFPNEATYFSWFKDFSEVVYISNVQMAELPIKRNITFKPGSILKSATGYGEYVVTDAYGTLRLIPNDARAQILFGEKWRDTIHSIPDVFWINYFIGQAID